MYAGHHVVCRTGAATMTTLRIAAIALIALQRSQRGPCRSMARSSTAGTRTSQGLRRRVASGSRRHRPHRDQRQRAACRPGRSSRSLTSRRARRRGIGGRAGTGRRRRRSRAPAPGPGNGRVVCDRGRPAPRLRRSHQPARRFTQGANAGRDQPAPEPGQPAQPGQRPGTVVPAGAAGTDRQDPRPARRAGAADRGSWRSSSATARLWTATWPPRWSVIATVEAGAVRQCQSGTAPAATPPPG